MSISPQQWLEVKPETRKALEKIFRIPRSTFTHVVNNKVESDGHTYEDLKAISIEEMQKLTGLSTNSFEENFKAIIKLVEFEPSPENATQYDLTSHKNGAAESSDQPINRGAETGENSQETVSQDQILPVSGGELKINRGRDEFLSNLDHHNSASLAAKDAEVHTQKPQARRGHGQKA